ncbi:ash family protein [Enterobacter bugandensis]|nr:ash family protein [Enterobacter bugandensis]
MKRFFCRGSAYPVRITVALAEQPKGWPFFFMHGIPTSVSATPSERRNSSGG